MSNIKLCPELQAQKDAACKRANDAYYDPKSPHYRDNEHYRWAIETISKSINEEQEELNKQNT